MDHAVLQSIARELAQDLAGQCVQDVAQLDSHRFLLRFQRPPFPRVHAGVHPRLSTIHLARGVKVPTEPTPLAVTLTRHLEGKVVTSVVKPPAERMITFRFGETLSLVVELMGKASNLLLMDGDMRILAFARDHAGAFRRPIEGAVYEPPPPHPAAAGHTLDRVTPEALRDILSAGGDDPERARALVTSLAGMSIHAAREIVHRVAQGADPWEVFGELRARIDAGPFDPVLYAPGDPGSLAETRALTSRNLFAFPFPLAHAVEACLTGASHATLNEAEEVATNLLLRHYACLAVRDSLAGVLKGEARRARDLAARLTAELEESRLAVARDRRRGELILAGLHGARRVGAEVIVSDPWDEAGGEVRVPIDPKIDLAANADRWFRSARRAGRRQEILPDRLRALEARAAECETALEGCRKAGSLEDLRTMEEALRARGIVSAVRRKDRPDVARRAEYIPVREFTTSDGMTVIVGRSSAENDEVTFRIAAPHDLWLHAAGRPGAHVVVRNPARKSALPDRSVMEAAAIAAWFSKARDEKQVDVHVAWRRHVRKGRGMSPGKVMLRRFRTVRVAPALPRGAHGPQDARVR